MYLHIYISFFLFFFFNDTATTEIYTLSLHDALPIYHEIVRIAIVGADADALVRRAEFRDGLDRLGQRMRSEEHTSELQSQSNLVCRLLLEKKKKNKKLIYNIQYHRLNINRHQCSPND